MLQSAVHDGRNSADEPAQPVPISVSLARHCCHSLASEQCVLSTTIRFVLAVSDRDLLPWWRLDGGLPRLGDILPLALVKRNWFVMAKCDE